MEDLKCKATFVVLLQLWAFTLGQVRGENASVIYATQHQIAILDTAQSKVTVLQNKLNSVQALAVDYEGRRMFWTESGGTVQSAVFMAKFDVAMATKKTVAMFGLKNPSGLAFDPRQKNLYISDSALPAILACRTQAPPLTPSSARGPAFGPVPNQSASSVGGVFDLSMDFVCVDVYNAPILQRPMDLALDHTNGYLYWIDLGQTPQIVRGQADGIIDGQLSGRGFKSQKPSALVSTRLMRPCSLSLDIPSQTLFWLDSGLDVIESIGLDGRNRKVIHSTENQRPSALVVVGDRILWAIGRPPSIRQTDLQRNGVEVRKVHGLEDDVTAMAALQQSIDTVPRSNACLSKPCTRLCLLGHNGSSVCACPDGHILSDRNGKCTPNNDAPILYAAYKDEILALSLARYGTLSPHTVRTSEMRNVYALEHLPVSGGILFTSFEARQGGLGKSTIYRLSGSPNTNGPWRSTVLVDGAGTVDCLVVDELGRLIYWVNRQKEIIEVASIDGQFRSRLMAEDIKKPYAIALDTAMGVLYVSEMTGQATIESCHGDGSLCLTLVSSGLVRPNALVAMGVDLYWTDSGSGDVSSVDIYTLKVTQHAIGRHLPHSLAVSDTVLLWTELQQHPQHEKEDEEDVEDGIIFYVDLYVEGHPTGLKMPEPTKIRTGRKGTPSIVVASSRHRDLVSEHAIFNNCTVNNGGCDQLCLPGPHTVTCLCSDGFLLLPDQASCQREDGACPDFRCHDHSKCLSDGQVCDFRVDCDDGSDEMHCPEMSCDTNEFQCPSGACIPLYYLCDLEQDCEGGKDEEEQVCREAGLGESCDTEDWQCTSGMECVHRAFRCDGDQDCHDGSDELHCDRQYNVCIGHFAVTAIRIAMTAAMNYIVRGEIR
ncbi:hypothetical protein EGW08_007223 [Elysia chlorotica]|uniref:EGF-like domain-containing protein n=1 Tax=Elysia chlorotica TaxID=188477 RepID=A0A3S1HS14_ELYCH|nr:hypothetical protein EGW08_007223 [Elysia chlorotica]